MWWCPGCGPWGGGMWGWGGWLWGLVMLIFWLLVLAGIVFLVLWVLRAYRRGEAAPPSGGTSRALEILKERYARGELTREQYDQMRRDILEDSTSR